MGICDILKLCKGMYEVALIKKIINLKFVVYGANHVTLLLTLKLVTTNHFNLQNVINHPKHLTFYGFNFTH